VLTMATTDWSLIDKFVKFIGQCVQAHLSVVALRSGC
jgi:hypothetical protein